MGVPGTADVIPSVLVTARSAWGVSESVSVVLVGVPPGGMTVAVLVSRPVAAASIVAVNVKATVAPGGRLTEFASGPVPLRDPLTLPPPVAPVNVQIAAITPTGRGSDKK